MYYKLQPKDLKSFTAWIFSDHPNYGLLSNSNGGFAAGLLLTKVGLLWYLCVTYCHCIPRSDGI